MIHLKERFIVDEKASALASCWI